MTLETGQNVSQIVHLTQWSSDPRMRSPSTSVLMPSAPAGSRRIAPSTSSAARWPVDRLMPSPDFSFHGTAPASVAPATSTFSSPSGRSSRSTATPARAIGCSAK